MKKNEEKTNAIRYLEQKKLPFVTHYYTDTDAISGMEIAEVLHEDPDDVFKTLVTVGRSGTHYVFIVPVNRELNLKAAAAHVGEKSVEMIRSKDLLGLTGYIHGGCSPIGMKKLFRTVIDRRAAERGHICYSGGKIGLQIESTLAVLQRVIPCEIGDISE